MLKTQTKQKGLIGRHPDLASSHNFAGCMPDHGGVLFDRWPRQCSHKVLSMGRNLIMVLLLAGFHTASAWTNGQLLIWMDADRASAMQLVAKKFERDYGIPVQIETPEKITDNFRSRRKLAKDPTSSFGRTIRWASGQMAA